MPMWKALPPLNVYRKKPDDNDDRVESIRKKREKRVVWKERCQE